MSEPSVAQLREELARVREDLRIAHARIQAMEQSAFWKARNAWWRLKSRLRGTPPPAPLRVPDPAAPADPRPAARAAAPAAPPPMCVSVALVVERGADPLPALDALSTHTLPPYGLVIVDDGGDDPERLATLAAAEGARLVRHDPPRGFGACAQEALAGEPEGIVAILSTDARPSPGWLPRMVSALEGSDAAVPLAVPAQGDGERFSALLAMDPPVRPTLDAVGDAPGILVRAGAAVFSAADTSRAAALAGYGEALVARGRRAVLADDVFLGSSPAAPAPSRVEAALHRRASLLRRVDEARREARARHEGRRVVFVLPVMERGGGANIVFTEALEMVRMGVDARVLNLSAFRPSFEAHYPDPEVPMLWADPHEIPAAVARFDAVVATANTSVSWLEPLARRHEGTVLGYYVQDFEPYFYPEGSRGYRQAFASYSLVPDMRLFTKTDWNRREVAERTGRESVVVGASFDMGTFRPRLPEPAASPVRLAAMVRPSSARRQPGLTMDVLEEIHGRFGDAVDITTFGEDREHPDWPPLERAFPHTSLGVADSPRLAQLYSTIHAFLDFSTYQAMGLSALEAMACGATVVLPKAGGGDSFATDGSDALFVDTSDRRACVAVVERIVREEALRRRLAAAAPLAAERFHPAFSAARILGALFPGA